MNTLKRKKSINSDVDRSTQIRCAIYTRKSTEEGLEQEFNSLDAQREAGEAYILSQQHEGWECSPDRYDDGGFTGANMDRPALKRLLADIESGDVDCVVVYKVDRLSRSLLDFSRIIESFDRHQVAFVSVTQAFNTASSMGRLILNVLLSFAQFEREMISERTRDKIAAARRKGKWSGGMPVLGYIVENTKLIVEPSEAAQVGEIFRMYLQLGSALAVAQALNQRGWRTKQWTTHKETERGGRPFNKSSVYKILTNVVYIGQVRYKAEIHDGEHEAIVDAETFEQAQTLLKRNGRNGGKDVRNKQHSLLRGLLHCGVCDCGMSHSYSKKGSKIYRYYVCQHAQQLGWQSCAAPSLPASEVESFVVNQIKAMGRDPQLVRDTLAHTQREVKAETKRLTQEQTALGRRRREDYASLDKFAADLSTTDPRRQEIRDRIKEADQRLGILGSKLAALGDQDINHEMVAAALGDFDKVWDGLINREQVRILELLLERVSYNSNSSQISLTYRPTGIQTLAAEFLEQT